MKRLIVFWAICLLFNFLAGAGWGRPLPDTNQTRCYNNTEEIICPEPEEDFYGQDATYLINPPSYTKLNESGNDLPDSAESWVMVRDNVTQLVWEVKTDDGSIHDKDNQYAWQNAHDVFIAELNSTSFGGHSDWRLPTIKELASITDLGRWGPAINSDYFPNTLWSNYWSSTTYAGSTAYFAWSIYFNYGLDYWGPKSESCYVRAVGGGQTGSLDHLVIDGDGTVTDTLTGLMWQQATDGTMNWEAAISHCEALSLAGYDDWRLPNKRELQSIVDYSIYKPAINTTYFPNTLSSSYWSSTTYAHLPPYGRAWVVYFGLGYGGDYDKSDSYDVRAVRGGQNQMPGHLVILSPAQASIWYVGDSMSITWETREISGNVKISISRQGAKIGTFETIEERTENDGEYNWKVTGFSSVNCVLVIEPIDDSSMGTGQGLFTVASSSTAYYVEPDGICGGRSPCESSINAAMETADPNTTIKVEQGTYNEDVGLNQSKELTLESGLDSEFNSVAGESTIRKMTIRKGSLVLSKGCLGIVGVAD